MNRTDNAGRRPVSKSDMGVSQHIVWLERGPRTLVEFMDRRWTEDEGKRRLVEREIAIDILQLNRWSDVYARCTHVIYGT